MDRFAHALKNSNRPLAATVRGDSPSFLLRLFRHWNQAGFAALLERVTFAAEVDRSGVVQPAIEDRRCDDRVAEDRAPFALAFVGSQNDAAPLLACADELKEDRGAQLLQR